MAEAFKKAAQRLPLPACARTGHWLAGPLADEAQHAGGAEDVLRAAPCRVDDTLQKGLRMTVTAPPDRLLDLQVTDSSGNKIGKADEVFVDTATSQPEWLAVATGFFGSKQALVPLTQAELKKDKIVVPYDKNKIKGAPHIDPDHTLSEKEEEKLYSYYGLPYSQQRSPSGLPGGQGSVGTDTDGPETDTAMTRSEERLHVGTEKQQTGKARLRKYVVTENVQTTVPVKHEELRVEREPITDANRKAATSGPAFHDEEHEVTLTEERPVVWKEEVPVERVRLDKQQVTEQQQVSEKVRKEQIEMEDPKGGKHPE
jgi:uncharacterized protein (TIGR02271 family)